MRHLGWAAFMFAVGAATTPQPARATTCSLATPIVHVVDPSMQATDQTPPTLPVLAAAAIARGHAPRQDGCAPSAMSCDDVGTISFPAAATDDMTPPERIGYRLSLSSGTLPAGLTLPAGAIEQGAQPTIFIHWDDGATDNQDGIDFTLDIVAIDSAGNESAPRTLRVSDDPGSGCAIVRPHMLHNGLAPLIVSTLAMLLLTARRRQTFGAGRGPSRSKGSDPGSGGDKG
jgi:hypothetical protein